MTNEYEEIIESFINGQMRQALDKVNDYGWYDFVSELEHDESLHADQKVEMLCRLIRTDKR